MITKTSRKIREFELGTRGGTTDMRVAHAERNKKERQKTDTISKITLVRTNKDKVLNERQTDRASWKQKPKQNIGNCQNHKNTR